MIRHLRILFSIAAFSFAALSLHAQVIDPVPHQMTLSEGKKAVNVSKGVTLNDVKKSFGEDLDFFRSTAKGISLTIDFGQKTSEPYGVKPMSGAYYLNVDPKGITAVGYDEKGAFNAIQTLRQMVSAADEKGRIPACVVRDWPDRKLRGIAVITPLLPAKTLSLIAFARGFKMDSFLYCPDDDPYCNSDDWHLPYPPAEADWIKKMMGECAKGRMDFVWAVRPGDDFDWSDQAYRSLVGKFEMMYYIGVRSFAVFLDEHPRRQEFIDRLNEEFITKRRGVTELVTDTEGFFVPGTNSESSKIDLYCYAVKGWNADDYEADSAIARAVDVVAPEVKEAYLTWLRHSCGPATEYHRAESEDVETVSLATYTSAKAERMMEECMKIEKTYEEMARCSDRILLNELNPYLVEFAKLGTRCRKVLECLDLYRKGDISGFWATYASNLMNEAAKADYEAHPSGTVKLQPFYERMMTSLAASFNEKYKDDVSYTYFVNDDIQTYIAPDDATFCRLVLNNPEGREAVVRLSDQNGRYVAEFCIEASYFEFELKEDAVKVEVIGDVSIFEIIFVK